MRFYGVDLADYWRGELSLRRLSHLLAQLPPESATSRIASDVDGWLTGDFLLADVYHALTGEAHPSRPKPRSGSRYAEKRRALEAQRARVAVQRAATTT